MAVLTPVSLLLRSRDLDQNSTLGVAVKPHVSSFVAHPTMPFGKEIDAEDL